MQKIFQNPSDLEKLAKAQYAVPQFLMMENAARGLADFILDFTPESVLILCGKGNNGGDGYAVARLLQDKCEVTILKTEEPTAEEARAQYEMCKRLGYVIPVLDTGICTTLSSKDCRVKPDNDKFIILDCIYGTGFHGELPASIKELLDTANKSKAIKIACDIPSGLYFHADYTITMGCQKLALYSDKAKAVCGKIIVQDLGISREKFENAVVECPQSGCIETTTYLIDATDITLPYRKNRAAHKGTYGHTAVFCGEKSGAAILAATAAMNTGSGLTTLIKASDKSDLSQFKISPSLMLSDSIPKKTTCIAAGSGFTQFSENVAKQISDWFKSQKTPAAVFDAGFITAPEFPALLKELNSCTGARIILTPHLAEFSSLVKNLTGEECSVSELAENPQKKIELGKIINKEFPQVALIIKSANTFIADNGETFIIADGSQSLAKGGSGDILAGMTASLLAQGYSAKDAAITAAYHHAQTAAQLGQDAYNLTPETLLANI